MIVGYFKNDVTFKRYGIKFPQGTYAMIFFKKEDPKKCSLIVYDYSICLSSEAALNLIGKNAPPKAKQIKWALEGFADSVGGNRIEADEWDHQDNPSWLLVTGTL